MASVSAIRPLPADVLSQIRSSVTIATLNDVVLNLVKNSLDSNASRIEVAVDYSRGSCSVEDDGVGIEPVEFSERGGLGKLHRKIDTVVFVWNSQANSQQIHPRASNMSKTTEDAAHSLLCSLRSP